MNILETCSEYTINLSLVNQRSLNNLVNDFGDFLLDQEYARFTYDVIEKYDIDENAIDYDSVEFLDTLLEDILESKIGKHPYYLVFAIGVKWNGCSGYKFVNDIKQTCYRDYDVTLTLVNEIHDKAIICTESSHDNPTGSTTIIVGISNKEYKTLKNADFNEIEKFATQFI